MSNHVFFIQKKTLMCRTSPEPMLIVPFVEEELANPFYITSKFTHTPYSQPQHGYHSTNIKFKPTCALLCPNVDALWISLTSFFSPCSRYNFFMKRTAQRLLFPSALCKLKLIIYSVSCPKS